MPKQPNNNDKFSIYDLKTLPADLLSGLVVFLVALPLCLGIAQASRPAGMDDPPLIAGLLTGIIAGLVVALISRSHTSVSGPAAGLTAIIATQISNLGSYEAFLVAVILGGVLQVVMGVLKAGALSAFFPSSVIKGLLAAIGVILILKEIPHLVGHDTDPHGEMAYQQPDEHTTFSELWSLLETGDIHVGAATIGLISVAVLLIWGRVKFLKHLPIPGALAVVLLGVGLHLWFRTIGGAMAITADHLVDIPVAKTAQEFVGFFRFPDFSALLSPTVYVAGITVAIVASLETLLNLEAVDKLDPERRFSPPSRELLAQGVGNIATGFIGGLPMTSVIIRSSVNVNSGCKTKRSAFFHGILLAVCVGFFPQYLNMIPISALAAILLVTGFKLASPKLIAEMWSEGRYQFLPFVITVVSIVFTDLLIGILIGLGVALLFILNSNLRRPVRRIVETHLGGDVMHIELANQVSFLNKAALDKVFSEAPAGSNVLIDASGTDYIDPDVLSLIRDFKNNIAPVHGVKVSLRGFRTKYRLHDDIHFADFSTRELQDRLTPEQALNILKEGNRRFRSGEQLSRDFSRAIDGTAGGQNPIACILGCIDSRVPAEIIFDLGIGDMFAVRVAGNIIGTKSLGSIEFGVGVAGVKLVVVLGHTRCGAVTSAVGIMAEGKNTREATGCENLGAVVEEVQVSVREDEARQFLRLNEDDREAMLDDIVRRNVLRTVHEITARSSVIRDAVRDGRVLVVGMIYDIKTGEVKFLNEHGRIEAMEPEVS
ncbi:SulP family inorganic anion transporter [Aeoliella sp. ICT_H6.2]|uniref:SulP family inorganic anion transporter n=1 Tax=Aeoliella straminimaris TaxID=2954799 RepID=A0A9X2JGT6_9BACT|nr:SulP family inorganic anion transporter [Aeoliella straminimaris]MCO6045086.1 SulP family inorganic anion transporter [Aeoliella straminimaris]